MLSKKQEQELKDKAMAALNAHISALGGDDLALKVKTASALKSVLTTMASADPFFYKDARNEMIMAGDHDQALVMRAYTGLTQEVIPMQREVIEISAGEPKKRPSRS